jgi:hypothetical protein
VAAIGDCWPGSGPELGIGERLWVRVGSDCLGAETSAGRRVLLGAVHWAGVGVPWVVIGWPDLVGHGRMGRCRGSIGSQRSLRS